MQCECVPAYVIGARATPAYGTTPPEKAGERLTDWVRVGIPTGGRMRIDDNNPPGPSQSGKPPSQPLELGGRLRFEMVLRPLRPPRPG